MSLFFEEENNRDFFVVRKEYELSIVYEANRPVYSYLSKVIENGIDTFLKRITRYDINGDIIKEDNYDDDTELDFVNPIEDRVINELGQIEMRIRYTNGKSIISKYEYDENGRMTSILKLKSGDKSEFLKYTYNQHGIKVKTEQTKNDGSSWISESRPLNNFPRESTSYMESNGEIKSLAYNRLNEKGIAVENISISWTGKKKRMLIAKSDDDGIVKWEDLYENDRFIERKVFQYKPFSNFLVSLMIYRVINNKLHLQSSRVYLYEYF